ncbi:MAG: hypothetical protein AAF679_05660 [Pseudomonadota bacterium]
MNIKCKCGAIILDTTDDLAHKAHIVGDKDYFGFLDQIDEAIESTETDREALCMKVRRAFPKRLAWECHSCGRLYLDDAHGNLVEYLPQNGKNNRIFDRPDPS